MIGSKFYVFGGQVDGEFLNDLWSFDLCSRESLLLFARYSSHLLYSENKYNLGISGPRRRFPTDFPSNWTRDYRMYVLKIRLAPKTNCV
jgi:hypothetical protein